MSKEDGSITYGPLEKASLLSGAFNAKQNNQIFDLPATSYPDPRLNSIAFLSPELKQFLGNLDSYAAVDPDLSFQLFLKKKSQTFCLQS